MTDITQKDNGGVWRPIKTAPKDGTKFVFLRIRNVLNENAKYFTDIGWFEGDELCVPYDSYGTKPNGMWPTHWMPLPEPPARKEGDT